MKMTRHNLVDYLERYGYSYHFLLGDRMVIREMVFMTNIDEKYTELPEKMTFESSLFMRNTPFKKIPSDIILKRSLSLNSSNITELPDSLYMNSLNVVIPFGTYIGLRIQCKQSLINWHLHDIIIGGYIVDTGLLS